MRDSLVLCPYKYQIKKAIASISTNRKEEDTALLCPYKYPC
ncbi:MULTISPECIES: hypothetical protein [unclassified Microcoleus]